MMGYVCRMKSSLRVQTLLEKLRDPWALELGSINPA